MDPISLKKNWADGQTFDEEIFNKNMTDLENTINTILTSTEDGNSGGDAVKMTPILALGADKDTAQKIVEALYVTIVNTVLGQIENGSIGIEKLNFDPATQEELNAVIETINAVSPMITQGDMIYRNATVPARLAKGLAKQMLSMNAGATAPEWIDSIYNLLSATGGLLYASAPNIPAMLALGTIGKAVMSNGTNVVYGYPDPPTYQASDNVILNTTTEYTGINQTTWYATKSFVVKYSGIVKLKFDVKSGSSGFPLYVACTQSENVDTATNNKSIIFTSPNDASNYSAGSANIYVVGGQRYTIFVRNASGYNSSIKNIQVCADISSGTLSNSIS